MMTIVYSVMWLIIAIYLLYLGIKDNKVFIIFSVYFLFNACWWFADYFVSAEMLHGTWGWIFRGITAVFLIIGVAVIVMQRKRGQKEDTEQKSE